MTGPLYPVAILAGGLATRLQPLTASVPKAIIDVNGVGYLVALLPVVLSISAAR